MRWVVIALLTVHGLLHLMGFAKAFGFAALPQLTQPISRGSGALWLAAGALVLATAVMLPTAPRFAWIVGLAALVLSQAAIVTSWRDARFGTAANVVLLLTVIYGFFSQGPTSFRAEYRERVERALATPRAEGVVTEADVARLPDPVARYVRLAGAVGQPRVDRFRARWSGRIRGQASDPWMTITAEQVNVYGAEPRRYFLIDAVRAGLPADVLHVFEGPHATMRVKAASMFTITEAHGPEMDQSETVTLLNDACLLAPAMLVDPAFRFAAVDATHADVAFTHGANTVRATLHFDEAGQLVDFVSDDRLRDLPEKRGLHAQRWSTPWGTYRDFGPARLGSRGEGRWHGPAPEGEAPYPDGSFAYIELTLDDVEYDVKP